MACAPRCGAGMRVRWLDSAESAPNMGKKKAPTGGARLSVVVRGEGRRTGPSAEWTERVEWAGSEDEKKKKEKEGVGWAERDTEGERCSIFLIKRFKHFNSNLNLREFKLELNNKQ